MTMNAGTANLTLALVSYDVSNALTNCSAPTCSFNLDKGSSQQVVVQVGMSSNPNDNFVIAYTKYGRSSYYWAIFGSVLAVVGVVFIGTVIFAVIRRRSSYTQF